MIDPGGKAARDAELDAALAAADERMLATISDRLDLDAGLAQLLSGRAGSSLRGHADAAKTGELAGAEAAQHHPGLAEPPWRRAPLPRQVTLTLVTAALDGVACYFAAQALGGSQLATLVWTALFLAVLAGGQVVLNFYRERNIRAWRALALGVGAIVIVLGILRCWFLAATGADGLSAAI